MKDTHNVILILLSPKWLIPSFGFVHDEVILGSSVHLFFPELVIISHSRFERLHLYFRSSNLSQLSHRKAPSKSLEGFTLCFPTSLSFYHPFITGVLHGSSTWWFVKDSFHSSIVLQDFSRSYDPPSYTLKSTWCSIHVLFWGFQVFFILHFEVQFSYLIFWDDVISFLTVSLQVLWFTSCQEWDI